MDKRLGHWAGSVALSTLPGSNSIQAYSVYTFGANLRQGVWRNNAGYSRSVPISSCAPVCGSASAWRAPIAITTLPGSGNMQAQDSFTLPQSQIRCI